MEGTDFVEAAPDVHVGDITGIVVGRRTLHVIDPGGRNAEFDAIRGAVKASGKKVGHILLTHEHNDHGDNVARYFAGIDPIVPRRFSRDTKLEIDGKRYGFFLTPGHCPLGDQSILVNGVLFAGDLISPLDITVVDDDEVFLASLGRISSIDFHTLFSAHGGSMPREDGLRHVRETARIVGQARELVRSAATVDEEACRGFYRALTGRTDYHAGNPRKKWFDRLFRGLARKYRRDGESLRSARGRACVDG
jgi:glyoxylase-like metal-dependent hydrolase (beta-lactamase superfamily II)